MFDLPNHSSHQEQREETTEKSHEELYQVHKIAVLGEGNLNFDGPGEITDINKESDILVVAKIKLLIREAIFVLLNVGFRNNRHLFSSLGSSCETGGPGDVEIEVFGGIDEHVQIPVLFIRCSHKIDGCVIAVILLGQAKGELIVNKKGIITCSFERVSLVSIFYFTELALVPLDALGGAEALARVGIAQ